MRDAFELNRLARALSRMAESAETYSGHCFRFVKPRYSNRLDAFSGEGSRKASGRFHVKGSFVIVYTSTDLKTAEWEYLHTARTAGINTAFLLPCVVISANVRLSKVLNLASARIRKSLKTTLTELRTSDWDGSLSETFTQMLGRLANEAGFEAILVPSSGGGRNLNLLRQNFQADSVIEIINESELLS